MIHARSIADNVSKDWFRHDIITDSTDMCPAIHGLSYPTQRVGILNTDVAAMAQTHHKGHSLF